MPTFHQPSPNSPIIPMASTIWEHGNSVYDPHDEIVLSSLAGGTQEDPELNDEVEP